MLTLFIDSRPIEVADGTFPPTVLEAARAAFHCEEPKEPKDEILAGLLARIPERAAAARRRSPAAVAPARLRPVIATLTWDAAEPR